MYGFVSGRLLPLLSLMVVGCCCFSSTAVAQQARSWEPPTNAPYLVAADAGYPASISTVNYNAEGGLESRVAELEAELNKMRAKDTAAKKKAAGKPSVQVGGRMHLDWAGFNQDAVSYGQLGDQENGVEFRRLWIEFKGEAFNVIDYKFQYDLAGTDKANKGATQNATIQSTAFKDVYFTIKELPLLGHVRVGHFKEPIGLEELTGSNYLTFMERSTSDTPAFVPARNTGVMAFDTYAYERGTWAIGAFASEISEKPPTLKTDDGGVALSMRGTYLPWYDEATEGRGLLHTGISYSYRDTPDDEVRFRARPECHLADYFVDTGDIGNVPSWQLVGLETALVYGPFSAQAEWFGSFVQRDGQDDLFFNGCYAYVSYFLTGEHRPYKRTGGVFDRVKPFENFFRVRADDGCVHTGKGAWELAYRYSYISLNDSNITGGRGSDHTMGVNWYLNPYTRLMFNYVNSTLYDGGEGNMSIFETRAQIDF